ncbi:MAG: T9SS type A sorting domain-containing protein [Flavipsychrobacter sp.]
MTATLKQLLLSNLLLTAILCHKAAATIYTASNSGNYTNATTWTGGNIPPIELDKDTIIIPQGITILLDTSIATIRAGNLLEVNGTLNNSVSRGLYFGQGTLSGSGIIMVDTVLIVSTAWNFNGQITTPNLSLGDLNINSAASINVSQNLRLLRDSIKVNQGSLTIAGNSTISSSGGILHQGTSGTVNYPSRFNFVQNNYGVYDANPLLYHPNVQQITIVLLSKDSGIKLTKDLTIDKVLYLNAGRLMLNGHHLSFVDTAQLATQPDGSISGDTNSSITIATHNGLSNGIPFYQEKISNILDNHVKNFTINTTNKLARLYLPLGLVVHNELNLQRGRLDINFATLEIRPTGNISGGSDSSFILTSLGGGVTQTLAPNDSLFFPVGTKKFGYTPAVLKNNAATAHTFAIGVDSTLLSQGTHGINVAHQFASVESSWLVTSTDTTNITIDLTLYWTPSMETNNLNRKDVFMSCYNQNLWDKQGSSNANSNGNHITLTRKQIKKLGVFAVREFTYIYIPRATLNKLTTTLYPNPTTGDAMLGLSLDKTQRIAIALTDATGRVVYQKEARQYNSGQHNITLPTSSLATGVYLYYITNSNGNVQSKGRLVKE